MTPTTGEENMGIQDRDYYWQHRKNQEQEPPPAAAPSPPDSPSWLRVFMDWGGPAWVLFAFVLLVLWLLKHRPG